MPQENKKSCVAFLFLLEITLVFSFGCSDLVDSITCNGFTGCDWGASGPCIGSLSISCPATKCLFVDSDYSSSGSGTIEDPYQTLSQALNVLSDDNTFVFVFNNYPNKVFKVTRYHSISLNVSIR